MKELLQKIGTAEVKEPLQLDNLCEVVKNYYANNKRHKYSEVSSYLMETADIEYLLENLRRIQKRLGESKEDELTSIKVFKLIDHITLELNRTKYNSKNFTDMQIASMNVVLGEATKKISSTVEELRQEQAQKINLEIEEFRSETEELKEKVNDSYSQFVSILGIFSAIVLVFFGGMTAFSSIFANMQNINRFKLAFITALVGMIIFNLIFMFLYVLAKLLGREIVASTASEVGGKFKFINWVKRIWGRYPYMLMFNITMLVIMMMSFISWYGLTYYNWKI
ncbi:MAG: hypothetical protein HFG47_00640 [Lachnospiraceae bacterium]|nr:hypothetical protein [Lachnospiraceae bacterium]